jgi:membrane protein implicated in regulation of membrane protease activity
MGFIRLVLAFLGLGFYLAAAATGLYALVLVWSVVQSAGGASVLEVAAALGVTGLFLLVGRGLSQRSKGSIGYSGGVRERLGR